MENLTTVFAIGSTITFKKAEVEVKKFTKDGLRIQVKPEAGKLFWITLGDFNITEAEGKFTLASKAKQIFSDAAVTKDLARSKGFQTMKDYIIHLIFDNQEMKPTELAKAFNLPNPIYVSKLMKNGDFSTIKGSDKNISKAWKAELAGETPEAKKPEAKKPVAEKPSKSQAENKKIADRLSEDQVTEIAEGIKTEGDFLKVVSELAK